MVKIYLQHKIVSLSLNLALKCGRAAYKINLSIRPHHTLSSHPDK